MMSGMGVIVVGVVAAVLATANLFVPDLGGSVYSDPTFLALGAAFIIAFVLWVRGSGYMGLPHLLIGAALLSFAPGLLLAGDGPYAASKVVGILVTFVILWATTQLLVDPRHRQWFIRTLAVLGVAVVVVLWRFGEASTFLGRYSFAGLNPISLGRMASIGALLSVMFALQVRGWRRLALLVVAIGSGYMAASTGSRGPVAAAILAGLLVTLLASRGNRTLRALAVIGAGTATVYLFTSLGLDDQSGLGRLLSTDSSNRNMLWADSVAVAVAHPGGVGFGNLYQHIDLTASMRVTGDAQYSHNILLETLAEGGVLALAGLLTLLVLSYRGLRKDSASVPGVMMLALWLFAFANALVSSDLVGNRLMWVMIAAGLALRLQHRFRPSAPTATPPAMNRPVDAEPSVRF